MRRKRRLCSLCGKYKPCRRMSRRCVGGYQKMCLKCSAYNKDYWALNKDIHNAKRREKRRNAKWLNDLKRDYSKLNKEEKLRRLVQ